MLIIEKRRNRDKKNYMTYNLNPKFCRGFKNKWVQRVKYSFLLRIECFGIQPTRLLYHLFTEVQLNDIWCFILFYLVCYKYIAIGLLNSFEPNFNSCIKSYYKIYQKCYDLFYLSPDFGHLDDLYVVSIVVQKSLGK